MMPLCCYIALILEGLFDKCHQLSTLYAIQFHFCLSNGPYPTAKCKATTNPKHKKNDTGAYKNLENNPEDVSGRGKGEGSNNSIKTQDRNDQEDGIISTIYYQIK